MRNEGVNGNGHKVAEPLLWSSQAALSADSAIPVAASLIQRFRVILFAMDAPEQSRQDSQFVEIVGRHHLITEIMRAGIEVAEPVRDRGIDLVAYIDLDSAIGKFLARPIQLKANWRTGFAFDRKYEKFHDLIVA